jgi:hypothetical protein
MILIYNDLIIHSDLSLLREIQLVDDPMNPLYYQSYIDEWRFIIKILKKD